MSSAGLTTGPAGRDEGVDFAEVNSGSTLPIPVGMTGGEDEEGIHSAAARTKATSLNPPTNF